MKYVIRAAPILVALALFVSFLAIQQSKPTQASHGTALGTIRLVPDVAATTTDVKWATICTSTTTPGACPSGATAGIVVHDGDETAASVSVTLTSDSDPTGITLTVPRVGTDNFRATFFVSTTTALDGDPAEFDRIKAADGDTVTVKYTDAGEALTRADTLKVETDGPVFANLAPAHETITSDVTQSVTVEVTDDESRVDSATIKFLVNNASPAVDDPAALSTQVVAPDSLADIKEGDTVIGHTATLSLGLTGKVFIGVKASDKAGNESIFDVDDTDPAKTMAEVLIDIAKPVFKASFTGADFDPVADELKFDKRDKILIVFTDTLTKLDAASIEDTDFSVENNSVSKASWFDHSSCTSDTFSTVKGDTCVDGNGAPGALKPGEVTSTRTGLETVDIRLAVVLTLGTDLGPGEKPEVSLIGDGVKDQAGNSQTTDPQKDAKDRIAPKIEVVGVSPTLAGDDVKVEIEITSDETLKTSPTVAIKSIPGGATTLVPSVKVTGTNSWRATTPKVKDTTAFNIFVKGKDKEDNEGKGGKDDLTKAIKSDGTVEDKYHVFEGDTSLPKPVVTPAKDAKPVERDPFFITIDWSATSTDSGLVHEGNEYDGDSHKTITVTKFELDGTDMLADVSTVDDKKFLVAVQGGLSIGEHKVKVNGKDEAGNVLASDLEVKFEVKERKAIKVSLNPGWNLISLPGEPSDPSIDSVMAKTPDASTMVTFDPKIPGGFLVAVRDTAGNWTGTLTSVVGSRGYWVLTDSFEPIEVDVPPLAVGAGILPPTLPIAKGWNLVPVLDATGTKTAGDKIVASDYFASMGYFTTLVDNKITAVYWFNTVTDGWTFVFPGDDVVIGRAYWVFAKESGSVVPVPAP